MSIRHRVAQIVILLGFGLTIPIPGNAQEAQRPGRDEPAKLQSFPKETFIIGSAQPLFTPWAKVISLQAGYVLNRMLVFHDTTAVTNPDGCSLVTNGYIINETDPGINTFNTMLLSAFRNGREVAMVISGCYYDRPRIVSVTIR